MVRSEDMKVMVAEYKSHGANGIHDAGRKDVSHQAQLVQWFHVCGALECILSISRERHV